MEDARFLVVSVEPDDEALRRLTKAEREVVTHVLSGLTDGEIARRRGVSTRTVSAQVASILSKLGAASRTELGAKLIG